jgi:hypothetical protein
MGMGNCRDVIHRFCFIPRGGFVISSLLAFLQFCYQFLAFACLDIGNLACSRSASAMARTFTSFLTLCAQAGVHNAHRRDNPKHCRLCGSARALQPGFCAHFLRVPVPGSCISLLFSQRSLGNAFTIFTEFKYFFQTE